MRADQTQHQNLVQLSTLDVHSRTVGVTWCTSHNACLISPSQTGIGFSPVSLQIARHSAIIVMASWQHQVFPFTPFQTENELLFNLVGCKGFKAHHTDRDQMWDDGCLTKHNTCSTDRLFVDPMTKGRWSLKSGRQKRLLQCIEEQWVSSFITKDLTS